MHPMLVVALVGGLMVLLAWVLWHLVRRWDRTNAVLAAAPPLPIRLVNVHDDVWIRGAVECDDPVAVPHFGHACIHFTYKLEEHVRKTRTRDGKTEVYYEWETRETADGAAPFRVVEEGHALAIDPARAEFRDEASDSERLGSWRHSCCYTPYPGEVSAVGVVDEDRRSLVPYLHVPLIVTRKERAAFLAAAERAERWTARFGLFFLLAGFCATAYGLTRYFQTPQGLPQGGGWDPVAAWVGGLAGVAATMLGWALRTYNSLVIFRTRGDESWHQIDVQLLQRYELVPNLVEIVKGYLKHEQGLLEHLASLRARAVGGGMAARVEAEAQAVADTSRLIAVVEAYPELKAQEQVRCLTDELVALEEKIAHARGVFNDAVKEYNTTVGVFPANLVAGTCGFRPYPMFAAELAERKAVSIKPLTTEAQRHRESTE